MPKRYVPVQHVFMTPIPWVREIRQHWLCFPFCGVSDEDEALCETRDLVAGRQD